MQIGPKIGKSADSVTVHPISLKMSRPEADLGTIQAEFDLIRERLGGEEKSGRKGMGKEETGRDIKPTLSLLSGPSRQMIKVTVEGISEHGDSSTVSLHADADMSS